MKVSWYVPKMQPAGILMTVSMQFDKRENDALSGTCAALQSGTCFKEVPDRDSKKKFLLRKYCAFRTVRHSHSDHTAINMRGIKSIVL